MIKIPFRLLMVCTLAIATVRWCQFLGNGEAFGMSQPSTATRTLNLRFPGQYFDSETGFHYNGQRYYDPFVLANQ